MNWKKTMPSARNRKELIICHYHRNNNMMLTVAADRFGFKDTRWATFYRKGCKDSRTGASARAGKGEE